MRKLLIITLFIFALSVHSQTDGYIFHSVGLAGMSDKYVQHISQDHKGYMWFSTLNGLTRYDGYNLKSYDFSHLGENYHAIQCAVEDGNGTLWIKTRNAYYYFDRTRDGIYKDIEKVLQPIGIKNTPKDIFVDDNHDLWCVYDSELIRCKFSTGIRECCECDHIALPESTTVVSIACRSGEGYILSDKGKISRIDWGNHTITNVMSMPMNAEWRQILYVDRRGWLWLLTQHSGNLQVYDMHTLRKITLPDAIDKGEFLFTSVTDDDNGVVWMSTDNAGIVKWDVLNHKVDIISRKHAGDNVLPTNHLGYVYKGANNILWVGTTKSGVAYTKLDNPVFLRDNILQHADVKCFIEGADRSLWLGLDGEGLVHIHPATGQHTIYSKRLGTAPSDIFICGLQRHNGTILFGTYGDGIAIADGQGIRPWQGTVSGAHGIRYVCALEEDRHGTIWIGTFMNGLYRVDGSNRLECLNSDNSPLTTNSITDLWCHGGDKLYIATGYGMFVMNTSMRIIQPLMCHEKPVLEHSYVGCVTMDSRGWLWMGTRNGVYVFSEQSQSLHHITMSEGLSDNHVVGIAEDDRHHMWLITDNGVTCIEITEGHSFLCSTYYGADGMGSTSFNAHAISCLSDNYVYMGSPGGYIKVNSASVIGARIKRNVVFTGLFVGNKKPLMEPGNEIVLPYYENDFSISLSCMDYGEEHKTKYMYRIDDRSEWQLLEGNRVYFNSMAPGHYTLEVRVAGSSNEDNVSRLTIIVRNPWWWSLPMRLLYVLLLAGAVYAYLMRMRKAEKQRLAQQQHEMQVTKQHEMDEAKLDFFTHVSHDLRTPLSLILIPAKKLLSLPITDEVQQHAQLIQRNASILLNEVNQLLDFKKIDECRSNLHLVRADMAAFVREICNTFRPAATEKGIIMQTDISDAPLMTAFDHDKMQRIVLNLLSNAVKYNTKGGTIRVSLTEITQQEKEGKQQQMVRLIVADTGIGIKDENKKRVFQRFFQEKHPSTYVGNGLGLYIVHEYVHMHEGTVSVTDNSPHGTIFSVLLPVIHQAADQADEGLQQNVPQTEQKPVGQKNNDGHPTILIVEDNSDMRLVLKDCLKNDYRIVEAENGREAIDMLNQDSDIQLVVSDVMMPVMDGMELVHHMKTDIMLSHIPIVLLTAKSAEESIIGGFREGADDYITKPFNPEILKLRIERILKWRESSHKRFRMTEVSPKEITVSSLDERLVALAIDTVEANMDNTEFTVEDLSAAVGMTRGHLYKKLMNITGMSPLEFIRTIRIKRGRQLLEQSGQQVAQVAWQVGLSPKQFSKYFKEMYGCLPSEFIAKT